jgi:hypothetical protein
MLRVSGMASQLVVSQVKLGSIELVSWLVG